MFYLLFCCYWHNYRNQRYLGLFSYVTMYFQIIIHVLQKINLILSRSAFVQRLIYMFMSYYRITDMIFVTGKSYGRVLIISFMFNSYFDLLYFIMIVRFVLRKSLSYYTLINVLDISDLSEFYVLLLGVLCRIWLFWVTLVLSCIVKSMLYLILINNKKQSNNG